jgi:hypothetical protein
MAFVDSISRRVDGLRHSTGTTTSSGKAGVAAADSRRDAKPGELGSPASEGRKHPTMNDVIASTRHRAWAASPSADAEG